MQASKVFISPENLNNTLLKRGKKTELRERLILEHIRQAPAGNRFKIADLASLTRQSPSNCWMFLKKMEQKNLIYREKVPKRNAYFMSVLGDAKTVGTVKFKGLTSKELEEKAKQFAWDKNSNDLREFIEWVKKSGS